MEKLSNLYVINREEAVLLYEALCEFRTPRWKTWEREQLLPVHQLIENLKHFIQEET